MVEKQGPDTDVKLWMASMQRDMEESKEELTKVHHTLFGNGKPGLDETVRNLNSTVTRIEDSVTAFEQSIQKTMTATLKWVVFGVFGLLIEIGLWAVSQGALS